MALSLARAGAHVVIAAIDIEEKMSSIQKTFHEENLDVSFEYLDVTNVEQIKTVMAKYQDLDILINGAGINVRRPMVEIDENDWDKVLDINLKGVFFTSQIAAKQMLQRKKGKIINIASLSSKIGLPNMGPYCASKGGVDQLTKAMSVEWAPHIQVNAIAPGYFKTELTEVLFQDENWKQSILSRIPTGRTGKPEDLNGITVLLASEESNYITGQTIYVDGGWTSS
ncbi:SDR family oxidoreductase [Halalkalibacter krulwichiae]|uniref:Gluconate 5-dehydrogenase n=2 Tax=Halalkalibacter krulwichiae TaxID=199441 RepID=A0A1X9MJG6_9BACI|nr:SDR family oxidoreductase [Halalkalibacter krulwichiae]ARK32433.1 Gluconate 5-dehydrogenase [Halalkalibacter krulwichiae]